jgi:hypothetical protein
MVVPIVVILVILVFLVEQAWDGGLMKIYS